MSNLEENLILEYNIKLEENPKKINITGTNNKYHMKKLITQDKQNKKNLVFRSGTCYKN
jgi:hypothetical protein